MSWESNLENLESSQEKKEEKNYEDENNGKRLIETREDVIKEIEEKLNAYNVAKSLEKMGIDATGVIDIIKERMQEIIREGKEKRLISEQEGNQYLETAEIKIVKQNKREEENER